MNQVSPGQLVIFGSPDNNPYSDAGYRLNAETNVPHEMSIGLFGYVPLQNLSSSSQLIISLVAPPLESNTEFSFFGQVISGVSVLAKLTTDDVIVFIIVEEDEE